MHWWLSSNIMHLPRQCTVRVPVRLAYVSVVTNEFIQMFLLDLALLAAAVVRRAFVCLLLALVLGSRFCMWLWLLFVHLDFV